MDEEKKQLAGKAFLNFTILFYTMTKNMYRHENQIRAHSLAFQTLICIVMKIRSAPIPWLFRL